MAEWCGCLSRCALSRRDRSSIARNARTPTCNQNQCVIPTDRGSKLIALTRICRAIYPCSPRRHLAGYAERTRCIAGRASPAFGYRRGAHQRDMSSKARHLRADGNPARKGIRHFGRAVDESSAELGVEPGRCAAIAESAAIAGIDVTFQALRSIAADASVSGMVGMIVGSMGPDQHPPVLSYESPSPRVRPPGVIERFFSQPPVRVLLILAAMCFGLGLLLGDSVGNYQLNPITYLLGGLFLILATILIAVRCAQDTAVPGLIRFLMAIPAMATVPAVFSMYYAWNFRRRIPPPWVEGFWFAWKSLIVCVVAFTLIRRFGRIIRWWQSRRGEQKLSPRD